MASKSSTTSPLGQKRLPHLYEEIPGLYEAPDGKLYFGLGEVCKKGYDHDGNMYFRVKPISPAEARNGWGSFREPFADEPMPGDYYPKLDFWDRSQRFKKPPPEAREGDIPKIGDEAYGIYTTADQMQYYGVGRVLATSTRPSPSNAGVDDIEVYVEPIPGKHGDEYQFYESYWQEPMDERNIPKAPYPLDDPQTINGGKKTDERREMPRHAKLGTEDFGSYIAPNGQWYCGVGRVMETGFKTRSNTYTYVEPIPGKHGGDYDFFHFITHDWMPQDQLPSPDRPNRISEVEDDGPLTPPYKIYLGIGKAFNMESDYMNNMYVKVVPSRGTYEGKANFWYETTPRPQGHIYITVEPLESHTPDPAGGYIL